MAGALVIGGTKNDWEAMAVFLLNFKTVMPEIVDDIIVFHDGITKKQQTLIGRIANIKFVRYRYPISKWRCILNKSIRYFSQMVFCKYECFRLLEVYDFVIWSDYDVIIKKDISEIVKYDSNFTVICNESSNLEDNLFPNYKENKEICMYDLMSEGICTPLFVVKKEIGDYFEYYSWCKQYTKKYMRYLYLPEQAIITMLVQKFQIKYEKLDRVVYCSHPTEDAQSVKILHAYGQPKFWNGLDNAIWNYYYHNWQELKK